MKYLTLLILYFLHPFSYSCGDHYKVMANKGTPLLHQSFNEKLKQFPDPNINYDRNYRGMTKYRTLSLKGSYRLALTYDDGPHPTRTPRLLDILKKYKVKATFFAMGNLIKKYPQIASRIVREGHTLASHDWTHINSNTQEMRPFRDKLKRSLLEVKKHDNAREVYYRFPYGAYGQARGYHHFNVLKDLSLELFNENCINFAFWDIDTSDWVSNMTAKDISKTIFANIDGGQAFRFKTKRRNGRIQYYKEPYQIKNPMKGGVVLMHDIHERTIDATELFLEKAMQRNIEFILLKDIQEFSFDGKQCQLIRNI